MFNPIAKIFSRKSESLPDSTPPQALFATESAPLSGRQQYVNDFYTGRDIDGPGRTPILGADMTEQRVRGISAASTAVSIVAENMASLKLELIIDDGKKEMPAKDEPEYWLFADEPNPNCNPYDFIEQMMLDVLFNGNSHAWIKRNNRGRATEIWLVPPEQILGHWRYDSALGFKFSANTAALPIYDGRTINLITGEDGFHFKRFTRNGVTGISPIQDQAETFGAMVALEDYQSSLFKNGVMPKGVLEAPKSDIDLDSEDVSRLSEQFHAVYGGLANSGRAVVLPAGFSYRGISLSPVDAELIANYNLSERKIAAIYRVPLFMLQNHEHSTFSNVEELSIQFSDYCLQPWAEALARSFTHQILTPQQRARGLRFKFFLERRKKGALKDRYDALSAGVLGGWVLRSEARTQEGYPWVEGMDEPMQPLNMTTPTAEKAKLEAIKIAAEAQLADKTAANDSTKEDKAVDKTEKPAPASEKSAAQGLRTLYTDICRRFLVRVAMSAKDGKSAQDAVKNHEGWFENQTKILSEFVFETSSAANQSFSMIKEIAITAVETGSQVMELEQKLKDHFKEHK